MKECSERSRSSRDKSQEANCKACYKRHPSGQGMLKHAQVPCIRSIQSVSGPMYINSVSLAMYINSVSLRSHVHQFSQSHVHQFSQSRHRRPCWRGAQMVRTSLSHPTSNPIMFNTNNLESGFVWITPERLHCIPSVV